MAANGLTQEQIAALKAGESTLHKRKKENEQNLQPLLTGEPAKGIALVTNKLMESIKGGNMTGMIFENQAGWKETNVQEHTGANGTKVTAALFYIRGSP